MTGSLHM